MSFLDTKIAVEKFLTDHWTATAIRYENVNFDPNIDVDRNPQPFIAISLRETQLASGGDVTLGSDNPFYRWVGIIRVEISTPEHKNPGFAYTYADNIKGLFKQRVAIVGATDISVSTTDNSYNATTTDFLLSGITAGMTLTIQGFTEADNNGAFTVNTVTQRKVKITSPSPDFINEVAGESIQMHGNKTLSYRNSGFIHTRISYTQVVGITNGFFQLNVNIPYYRDSHN